MQKDMENEKRSCPRGMPPLRTAEMLEVNDDPAQILDVLTRSEQEAEPRGAEIDVGRFAYESPPASLSADDLDRLLADAADEVKATTEMERDVHEHNGSNK